MKTILAKKDDYFESDIETKLIKNNKLKIIKHNQKNYIGEKNHAENKK